MRNLFSVLIEMDKYKVTVVFICLIVKLLYVTVDFIDYIFIFVEDMGIV